MFIVNPAGITFGAGSQVNVAGLLASTLNIQDSDFLGGDLRFVRDRANGKITSQGSLNAGSGNVVLLSPTILSQGSISANAGNIFIVSADGVRVQDNNAIVLQAPVVTSIIRQSGQLNATSLASAKGKILLIADKNHPKSEMKVQGNINAQNIWIKGKDIVLPATLTVQGNAALEAAGNIVINATPTFLPDSVNGQQRLLSLTYAAGGLQRNNYSTINLPDGASQLLRLNGDVYRVLSTASQLQAIGLNSSTLQDRYVLGINIDASETASWNSGAGFSPIGNNTPPFSGVLEGMGHAINGLVINRPDEDRTALFGYVNGATISNLYLGGFNIKGHTDVAALAAFSRNSTFSTIGLDNRVSGVDRVGMLAGFSIDSSVRDSYFMGKAEGTGLRLGGLIGYNRGGVLDNITGTAQVNGYSAAVVGGLVGYSENALIQNSGFYGSVYRNGSMSAYPQAGVGGLVGYMASGELRNSNTLMSMNVNYGVGGLVGVNNGTIADSHSDGLFGYAGGLVYQNNGLIQRSYSTATVSAAGLVVINNGTIEDSYYQGPQESGQASLKGYSPDGLVGYNSGLIQRSYVQANVSSIDTRGNEFSIGGLVGSNYATGVITDSWMQGDVVSTARYVGGLVGSNWGRLKNSYVQAKVTGVSSVGGAVGANYPGAVVENVRFNGTVRGSENIGGLVGSSGSGAVIRNSSAMGNVFGNYFYRLQGGSSFFSDREGTTSIGGLVGYNLGLVEQSTAASSVIGGKYVGGLVGQNALFVQDTTTQTGTVNDSYATGTVNGLDVVGGLVGNNDGSINQSYAAGSVTGSHGGGLAGFANVDGVVTNSYWNVASTGRAVSSGGKGLTDALSRQKRMYAGWDISTDPQDSSIWYINEGVAMPVLRGVAQP